MEKNIQNINVIAHKLKLALTKATNLKKKGKKKVKSS